jgi:uncharacterized protein with HEPN domain
MKDDLVYVGHIQECIAKIETYTAGGRQEFMSTPMIQDAVMRNLEIVWEASSKISAELRQAHPEVRWRRAINLRNVLIHNYPGVHPARVWADVTQTVPEIKGGIAALLAAVSRDAAPSEEA